MTASARRTLSGWQVVVDLQLGDEPAYLTPPEARALAAELLAEADEAELKAACDDGLPLRDRILKRLACCSFHVPGGLAKLLGEKEAEVVTALAELQREGKVELWRGLDGFFCLAGCAS